MQIRIHFSCSILCALLAVSSLPASPVAVRQLEGQLRGFLVLRAMDGTVIADGDLIQVTRGATVSSRLSFRFKDGSLQDETAVFSQRGRFRLLSDHLVQKGPSFKHPLDLSIHGSSGVVTVHYESDHGTNKTETSRMKLPPDLANGMVPILLKNLAADAPSTTVSMVVATPKPLLVKLEITSGGTDSFSTGGSSHKATRYVVKVKIGGVRGVLAPLVGKQPPDTSVWILGGNCPAFLKSEGPSYDGGPIWRIELVSPVWPSEGNGAKEGKK